MRWPPDAAALEVEQRRLARERPPVWDPPDRPAVGASYFTAGRGAPAAGDPRERAWAAAARKDPGRRTVTVVAEGSAGTPYVPGLLALREGALREAALRLLDPIPDVVIVDATGRDHPRGAGLALHLGAVAGVPTVGVTDRPLAAAGDQPGPERGAISALWLHGVVVGAWVRTRPGVRPVAVHAAWRTTLDVAVAVVLAAARRARTPQPLREARRAARAARGAAAAQLRPSRLGSPRQPYVGD